MNLTEATDSFIEVLSSPLSSDEEVNTHLQECFTALPEATATEVDEFMLRLFSVFGLPDLERGSLAATICGYLVERGFSGKAILIDFIRFYESLLDNSRPFFDIFLAQVASVSDDDEDRDQKVNTIFQDLLHDTDIINSETAYAVAALDKFYACAISLFSVNRDNFFAARQILKEKATFPAHYNQGCYWITKLFTVCFDEPIVVIDIDKNIGFSGKINGVVDNYQLQHLLMALPALNDGEPAISEEYYAIISGNSDIQTSDNTIVSKWNMYNLELAQKENWKQKLNETDTWIWSEGTPADISLHNGYRVILLGKPSYSRESRIQRTFRNLKANIEIEKQLSGEEIKRWLNSHN